MSDSADASLSSNTTNGNTDSQSTPNRTPATWDQVASRLGLATNLQQLTPEQYEAQGGRVFTAPALDQATSQPPAHAVVMMRLQQGYNFNSDGFLVRLPDASNGQSRWAGNDQIASTGVLVQRHTAFYNWLASRLEEVPSDVGGSEVVNHLLGKRYSADADRIFHPR